MWYEPFSPSNIHVFHYPEKGSIGNPDWLNPLQILSVTFLIIHYQSWHFGWTPSKSLWTVTLEDLPILHQFLERSIIPAFRRDGFTGSPVINRSNKIILVFVLPDSLRTFWTKELTLSCEVGTWWFFTQPQRATCSLHKEFFKDSTLLRSNFFFQPSLEVFKVKYCEPPVQNLKFTSNSVLKFCVTNKVGLER